MSSSREEVKGDYKNRVDRVFKYIDKNLDGDLALNKVAEVAFFSPFHFHRVFKSITGETLNAYVTRKRIEKAAAKIIHNRQTITELSVNYGFSDNSSFTRTFKKFYGVSPTEFQKQNPNKFSKIRQLNRKNGQAYPDTEKYICIIDNHKNWIKMNANIEVKTLPKLELAYVSCIGSENVENAYAELVRWATPKALIDEKTRMVTIYHDSFKVTEASKVRISACIVLNEPINIDAIVGKTCTEEGKYIVGRFEIEPFEFEKAWTGVSIWMSENGYKKADRNGFDIYYNNYREHPEGKFIVDLCMPVE
ncbi:AraC family transcriptional regulator [Roseivirga misakiensis]|uniref:AraC family transcriptional regulator n=1 Tax=Roseivirga misakiensis TaxID=1563681 RepID=A0A1E5SL78_9BACT|nr:AraC family transcriptional regulator [Roseivirga misakiensis]OEJ99885.1 AraC family transcriptional regulator [Roseivirga misakiensis]